MQVPFFHYLPISCLSSQWGGVDSLLFPHLSPSSHGSSSTPYTVVTGRYLHRSTLSESEECTFSVDPASSKHNGVGGCFTGPVTRRRSRGDRCCWHNRRKIRADRTFPNCPRIYSATTQLLKLPPALPAPGAQAGRMLPAFGPFLKRGQTRVCHLRFPVGTRSNLGAASRRHGHAMSLLYGLTGLDCQALSCLMLFR